MRIVLSEMAVEGIKTNIPCTREFDGTPIPRQHHQHPGSGTQLADRSEVKQGASRDVASVSLQS